MKALNLLAFILVFCPLAQAQDDGRITERQELINQLDDQPSSILSIAGVAVEKKDSIPDNSGAHFGFGILYEANLNDNFGVETGVLYIKRQYETKFANAKLVTEVARLHIPLLARYWVNDYLAFALGPYMGLNIGSVDSTVVVGDTNTSYETSADDDLEFGFDLAATANMAINDKTGLFVEGRYSQLFDKSSNVDYQRLIGLAGLKLDM